MDNLDNLFDNQKTEPTFDVNEWAQNKNEKRTRAYETISNTSMKIGSDSQMFQKYLDIQSQFDVYSSNNVILILSQKPEATMIKDSATWRKSKTYIKKGEKRFTILEPGKKYQRDDGTMSISYNPKTVFDISQTTAQPQNKSKSNLIMAIQSLLD